VVAREAGSANGLLPVIHDLCHEPVALRVFGLEQAASLFRAAPRSVACTDMAQVLGLLEYLPRLPDFILSGTSAKASEDALLWDWAAARAIPLLAFVDHWIVSWVQRRFSSVPGGAVRYDLLPSKVAVMDAAIKRQMVAEGCEAERIIVTGHPRLQYWARHPPPVDPALRTALLAPDERRLVVFCSEPYARFQPRWRLNGGPQYDQFDVLKLLFAALRTLAIEHQVTCRLLIKPHPSEDLKNFKDCLLAVADDALPCRVVETPCHHLASAADLVVGMRSMALLEARVLGCRVLSIQPDQLSQLVSVGDVPIVNNQPALMQALAGFLLDSVGLAREAAPSAECVPDDIDWRIVDYVKSRIGCAYR
jgi:hypothetical protein